MNKEYKMRMNKAYKKRMNGESSRLTRTTILFNDPLII